MIKITFNSVLDGISLALRAAFPTANIHSGTCRQGIADGDFNIIVPVITKDNKLIGTETRGACSCTADIIYYSDSKDSADYCMVADFVTDALKDITTPEGCILHSLDMKCAPDVSERVLHVTVTYKWQTTTSGRPDTMDDLKISQEG